jgi:hypothetical protein
MSRRSRTKCGSVVPSDGSRASIDRAVFEQLPAFARAGLLPHRSVFAKGSAASDALLPLPHFVLDRLDIFLGIDRRSTSVRGDNDSEAGDSSIMGETVNGEAEAEIAALLVDDSTPVTKSKSRRVPSSSKLRARSSTETSAPNPSSDAA